MDRRDFELLRDEEIPELNTRALLYRHRTGCEIVSLINDDENKVLASTSAPHRPTRPALPTSSNTPCSAARASTRSRSRLSS